MRKLVLILAVAVFALGACGGEQASDNGGGGAPEKEALKKLTMEAEQEQIAPEKGKVETGEANEARAEVPQDKTLRLTVPEMEGVRDAEIPTSVSTDEERLRTHAAIHLEGTGFPWEEEANVYIAGHRIGYRNTESYLAFYDIDELEKGDEVSLTDANGKEYTYKVFRKMIVGPYQVEVVRPLEGRNIVSLQACTLPDYSKRVIVQAELQAS